MTKDPATPDGAAFVRDMLGQWESIAQEFGSSLLKTGEFARTVNNATAASVKARGVGSEVVSEVLAAAAMPSRADVARLTERIDAVDARLARIEALLESLAGKPKKAKKAKG
ncbi:hypothetical protein ACMT1E_14675 [Sphingomonas flavalba]|uniref:hypothetical protein n=1 Tax=Sphingomonas flavalba TaxID=2559804 RepID=UPI0039E053E3